MMKKYLIGAIALLLISNIFAVPTVCPAQLSQCSGLDPFWQGCFTPDAEPRGLIKVMTSKIGENEGMQVMCIYGTAFLANTTAKITLNEPSQWQTSGTKRNPNYICSAAGNACQFTVE
jgi:hypothetical protein